MTVKLEANAQRRRHAGEAYVPLQADPTKRRLAFARIKSPLQMAERWLEPEQYRAAEKLERNLLASEHRVGRSGRHLDSEESTAEFARTVASQRCAEARRIMGDRRYLWVSQWLLDQISIEHVGWEATGHEHAQTRAVAGRTVVTTALADLADVW
jgi:hypothetical protein